MLASNSYRVGDIIWGALPADDGRRTAVHPGLVLDCNALGALVVVGTTKHVARATADGQVVVRPDRVPPDTWSLTGLAAPTGFDIARGRLTFVRHGQRERFPVVGTIDAPQSAWLADLRQSKQIALALRV